MPLGTLSHFLGMKTNSYLSKPVVKANFDGRKNTATCLKLFFLIKLIIAAA